MSYINPLIARALCTLVCQGFESAGDLTQTLQILTYSVCHIDRHLRSKNHDLLSMLWSGFQLSVVKPKPDNHSSQSQRTQIMK